MVDKLSLYLTLKYNKDERVQIELDHMINEINAYRIANDFNHCICHIIYLHCFSAIANVSYLPPLSYCLLMNRTLKKIQTLRSGEV
jgi:hypothetical protein